jgi:hypothetical protein
METFLVIIVAVAIDRKQLPESADVLQQMVLDLIAQLESEQARREKTEYLLRQLLAARSGRSSERLSDEQLALFAKRRSPTVQSPPRTMIVMMIPQQRPARRRKVTREGAVRYPSI